MKPLSRRTETCFPPTKAFSAARSVVTDLQELLLNHRNSSTQSNQWSREQQREILRFGSDRSHTSPPWLGLRGQDLNCTPKWRVSMFHQVVLNQQRRIISEVHRWTFLFPLMISAPSVRWLTDQILTAGAQQTINWDTWSWSKETENHSVWSLSSLYVENHTSGGRPIGGAVLPDKRWGNENIFLQIQLKMSFYTLVCAYIQYELYTLRFPPTDIHSAVNFHRQAAGLSQSYRAATRSDVTWFT